MKKGFFKRAAAFATAVLMAAWVITVLPDGCLPQIGTVVSAKEAEAGGVAIDEVNFPDDIFRQYVLDECDIDHDGFLSDEEIGQVTKIIVMNSGIQSLNGIEYFTSLENLDCARNLLTSLDVSSNTALSVLDCRKNNLISLDTSSNTALSELICSYNNLTSLDLSRNTALSELYCYNNNLTSLDISNNTLLKYLDCDFNQLTSLDVSKNTALIILGCDSNQLTSLDVGNNTALTDLRCDGNRYNIGETCGAYDLKNLPVGFDLTKASNWQRATLESDVLTGIDGNGFISYDYDCGNNHTATFYLIYDYIDHIYDDGVIIIEPTEDTEGKKTYTCTKCGATKTEPIANLGHVHNQGAELISNETGHWYACSDCDEKLDFATHTEDAGTVTVEPTETTEGQKVYKCTVCDYTIRTETIAKLGNGNDEPTVPSQPTNPTEPSQPSNPTEPSNPSQPSTPDNGGNSSNGNTSTAAPVGGTKTETLTVKVENKVTGKASKARAQKTGNSVSVKLGTENNGYYANVYTTDDDYICSAVIENGRAKFSVPEGIKIKIVIDSIAYGEDVSSGGGIYETDYNSQAPLCMVVIIIAALGFTSITIVKRFGKNKR